MRLILVLLLWLATVAYGNFVTYEGHQVIRFFPKTAQQLEALAHWAESQLLDVWTHHMAVGTNIDIQVPPSHLSDVPTLGIDFEIFMEDLQQRLSAHLFLQSEALRDDSFFHAYRTFEEIGNFTTNAAKNYSSIATLINLGKTLEGRDILGLALKSPKSKGAAKQALFFNGCQHAREWISPMTVAYLINAFLSQYGHNQDITDALDKFDFYMVPVVNGDGYVYTHTRDRMWRKNRRHNSGARCDGVDTNRNWGFHWNEGGSSNNPCAEDYHGPSAFSEPENKAVADFISAHPNINGYIDFHSYSQLWMSPWGYTGSLPADYNKQMGAGNAAAAALKAVHGTSFEVGPIYSTIYPASGSSNDWTYGQAKAVYSYGVELRDRGQYGFLLPPSQIIPSGEEILAAILAMAKYMGSH